MDKKEHIVSEYPYRRTITKLYTSLGDDEFYTFNYEVSQGRSRDNVEWEDRSIVVSTTSKREAEGVTECVKQMLLQLNFFGGDLFKMSDTEYKGLSSEFFSKE